MSCRNRRCRTAINEPRWRHRTHRCHSSAIDAAAPPATNKQRRRPARSIAQHPWHLGNPPPPTASHSSGAAFLSGNTSHRNKNVAPSPKSLPPVGPGIPSIPRESLASAASFTPSRVEGVFWGILSVNFNFPCVKQSSIPSFIIAVYTTCERNRSTVDGNH